MSSRVLLTKMVSSMKARNLKTGLVTRALGNANETRKIVESERMKKFHEKLKSESYSSPGAHVDGIIMVDTDSKKDGTIGVEVDPTKWGDWQNGGRVTDF